MISRRAMVAGGALALAGSTSPARSELAADKSFLPQGLPEGVYDAATLEALPGKKPLIKLSYRPPNYETPLSYFTSEFTPNDSFLRPLSPRRHSGRDRPGAMEADGRRRGRCAAAGIDIERSAHKLRRGGGGGGLPVFRQSARIFGAARAGCAVGFRCGGECALEGRAAERCAEPRECAARDGRGRTQWRRRPGARWDAGFIKSIPLDKALDENTLIAYEMNGAPLPHYNGFPVRLVLPGWTATYWMKHLVSIEAATKPFPGFWMKNAYRIPNGKFPIVQHFLSQMAAANEPITEMVINSMITAPAEGFTLHAGEHADIRGVAWDGGYGIARVEISTDGGDTWREAELGKDVGRFAFRVFRFAFVPPQPGRYQVMARAGNTIGQTQAEKLIFNPAGYNNNVVRPLTINAV